MLMGSDNKLLIYYEIYDRSRQFFALLKEINFRETSLRDTNTFPSTSQSFILLIDG